MRSSLSSTQKNPNDQKPTLLLPVKSTADNQQLLTPQPKTNSRVAHFSSDDDSDDFASLSSLKSPPVNKSVNLPSKSLNTLSSDDSDEDFRQKLQKASPQKGMNPKDSLAAFQDDSDEASLVLGNGDKSLITSFQKIPLNRNSEKPTKKGDSVNSSLSPNVALKMKKELNLKPDIQQKILNLYEIDLNEDQERFNKSALIEKKRSQLLDLLQKVETNNDSFGDILTILKEYPEAFNGPLIQQGIMPIIELIVDGRFTSKIASENFRNYLYHVCFAF